MKKLITLYPIATTEEARVGVGLALVDDKGRYVKGDITWRDYDRQAALTDGTVGILKKYWFGLTNKTIYWLEVKESA